MSLTVAVTGGTGFLGRPFVAHALTRGCRLRVLVRPASRIPAAWRHPNLELVRGALADERAMGKLAKGSDAFVHLAAAGVSNRDLDWRQYVVDNARDSLRCVRIVHELGVKRLVAAGSCLEYAGYGSLDGAHHKSVSFQRCTEDAPLAASGTYGMTKACSGRLLRAASAAVGLRCLYLRFASMYGPGDSGRKVLPAAIATLSRGQPFLTSGGEQVREWLHVEDAVHALWAALHHACDPAVYTLNIGTGEGVMLADMLLDIAELLGVRRDLVCLGAVPYRPLDPRYLVMDISRQSALLGYQPRKRLADGLRELVQSEVSQAAVASARENTASHPPTRV